MEVTSDDIVFYKTGGKWNQCRRGMTRMSNLIDEKMELWLKQKNRGKKHSKRAFLEEHVLPNARLAYACESDGSLRVLSECEVRGKFDEIFKKRNKKRRSTSRRSAVGSSVAAAKKKEVQVREVHGEEDVSSSHTGVSTVSGSEPSDGTYDDDDSCVSTFGSMGNIELEDCFSEDAESILANDVDGAATTVARICTFHSSFWPAMFTYTTCVLLILP